MNNRLDILVELLEKWLEKHWEKQITNKWLLNLLKKSEELELDRGFYSELESYKWDIY